MLVKIIPNDKGNPPGKLADAELHFTDGPLAGLKLIGSSAMTPAPRRGITPPIDTRSFINVVSETRQPSPGLPSIAVDGMRVSVK